MSLRIIANEVEYIQAKPDDSFLVDGKELSVTDLMRHADRYHNCRAIETGKPHVRGEEGLLSVKPDMPRPAIHFHIMDRKQTVLLPLGFPHMLRLVESIGKHTPYELLSSLPQKIAESSTLSEAEIHILADLIARKFELTRNAVLALVEERKEECLTK